MFENQMGFWGRGWGSKLGWTGSSYLLLSLFFLTLLVLGYVWWPLAEEYLGYIDWQKPLSQQLDWLLLGIFAFMTLTMMLGADVWRDAGILLVGLAGGFVIESWGTQTELWQYYTLERPPLWIIPAWPIATLTIDRLVTALDKVVPAFPMLFRWVYWVVLPTFYLLMFLFVTPQGYPSLTILALIFCALLILTPTDFRLTLLTFVAGAGLGYFLELWGTTRLCWSYYTQETPPLFAVLAHGMAAVAFWRVGLLGKKFWLTLAPQIGVLNEPRV